jgi:hypothetical protein
VEAAAQSNARPKRREARLRKNEGVSSRIEEPLSPAVDLDGLDVMTL